MFNVNSLKNRIKKLMPEFKTAKSMALLTLNNFNEMLYNDPYTCLVRQVINIPRTYQSVRILLQPYLVGREREVFGKRYESFQYKVIPDIFFEDVNNYAKEHRLNGFILAYHDLPWSSLESKISENSLEGEPAIELFSNIWNYKEKLPNVSVYNSVKYDEFAEKIIIKSVKKNIFIKRRLQ